jgi:hypothetical protein
MDLHAVSLVCTAAMHFATSLGNILLNLKGSSLQIRFAHKCCGLIDLGEETQSWSVNSIILVIFAFLKDL